MCDSQEKGAKTENGAPFIDFFRWWPHKEEAHSSGSTFEAPARDADWACEARLLE